ncbi:MAG: DUF1385 domain-containing protein [Solirubrobacterales bacterium]
MSADPKADSTNTPPAPQFPMEADKPIRLSDDLLMSPRDLPIGGQAVLEGVMMRGVSTWAVGVRLPADRKGGFGLDAETGSSEGSTPSDNGAVDGPVQLPEGWRLAPSENGGPAVDREGKPLGGIEVHSEPFVSSIKRHRLLRLPIVRGVVALVESMKIGIRALMISANAQLDPDEQEEITSRTWAVAITVSLVFAVGLFFVLPVVLTNFGRDQLGSSFVFVVVEKLVRISILIGYIWLISRINDLRRVYEYHGAEHKTIACYEGGEELTPENAKRYSRFHIRCGTSFLLIVVIVAFLVFAPLGILPLPWLIASRIIGFPIVTGIAYEVIRWAGRNRRRRWVRALMWPGLQLQRLTTREPSLDQLAVAIASLEAVLSVENPDSYTEQDLVGMEVGA